MGSMNPQLAPSVAGIITACGSICHASAVRARTGSTRLATAVLLPSSLSRVTPVAMAPTCVISVPVRHAASAWPMVVLRPVASIPPAIAKPLPMSSTTPQGMRACAKSQSSSVLPFSCEGIKKSRIPPIMATAGSPSAASPFHGRARQPGKTKLSENAMRSPVIQRAAVAQKMIAASFSSRVARPRARTWSRSSCRSAVEAAGMRNSTRVIRSQVSNR